MSLEELLHLFPISQLGYALVEAGLPGDGVKHERVSRLIDWGRGARITADQLLSHFKAEALRAVCSQVGIVAPTKTQMIEALATVLPNSERGLSRINPDLVVATLPGVLGFLRRQTLPARIVRTEADAERALESTLRRQFAAVSTQYSVGGYLGYRIDIDLGNGIVGVEVKLTESVIGSASEAYRTLGQALVYDRRRYHGKVIVALVGADAIREQPTFAEIEGFLREMGAHPVLVPVR